MTGRSGIRVLVGLTGVGLLVVGLLVVAVTLAPRSRSTSVPRVTPPAGSRMPHAPEPPEPVILQALKSAQPESQDPLGRRQIEPGPLDSEDDAPTGPRLTVTGQLVDPAGRPWAQAPVRLHTLESEGPGIHATTDERGRFRLVLRGHPRNRTALLELQPEGGVFDQRKIRPLPGRWAFRLGRIVLRSELILKGRLIDAEEGRPARGWDVVWEAVPRKQQKGAGKGHRGRMAITSETGEFTLSGLPPGSCRLWAECGPLSTRRRKLGISADKPPITLRVPALDGRGCVAVVVQNNKFDRWGWPDPAALRLVGEDGPVAANVQSTGEGRYLLCGLEPDSGPYALEVADDRFEAKRVLGLHPGGEEQGIALTGSSSLSVDLLDPGGPPVLRATLILELGAPKTQHEVTLCRESANLPERIGSLPACRGRLRVIAPQYRPLEVRLELTPKLHTHLALNLKRLKRKRSRRR